MNLWIRIIIYFMTLPWRPRLELPIETSRLRFRVLPTDLDISLHMNNGRYLTLMDLGRLDILFSSGLWRIMLRNRLTPIASAVAIRYRRELRLADRIMLRSKIVAWDDKTVVIEQIFAVEGGPKNGQVAAQALFKGGLYDRRKRAFSPISTLMESIGVEATSPEPTPEIAAFLATDTALKQTERKRT
ncbi:MAG: thioesterase family protein [Hyphomicrobiaceae bacterium]